MERLLSLAKLMHLYLARPDLNVSFCLNLAVFRNFFDKLGLVKLFGFFDECFKIALIVREHAVFEAKIFSKFFQQLVRIFVLLGDNIDLSLPILVLFGKRLYKCFLFSSCTSLVWEDHLHRSQPAFQPR